MTELGPTWRHAGITAALLPPAQGAADQVRSCAAALLGHASDRMRWDRTAGGKPVIVSPPGAAFSVARRDGFSLLGVAWGSEVGVDLELVRPDIDACGIADAFFDETEAAWMRSLPFARRAMGFTALWVAKEAVLKAAGRGITRGLASPVVEGDRLLPLLAGADRIALTLPNAVILEVRRRLVGGRLALACLSRSPRADQHHDGVSDRFTPEASTRCRGFDPTGEPDRR